MKKVILLTLLTMFAPMAFAQFTVGSTFITYTGHSVPTGANTFYDYQPNNSGGTVYQSNCSTPLTGLGGFDPMIYDATTTNPARSTGVMFYGGKLATVYYGNPCVANIPSIGFSVGSNVDLSAPANQKIQFQYQSDSALSLQLQLFDASYVTKLNTVPVTILGDNTPHTVTINFSSDVTTGADLTIVRQVSLLYNSTTLSRSFQFSIGNISVGSAVTTGIESSTAIAGLNLFPNPSNGTTTISGDLQSYSAYRIVLVDMLGQEVKVITDSYGSSVNTTFDVSSLAKGLYSIVYQINGVPAKSQKLIVQ